MGFLLFQNEHSLFSALQKLVLLHFLRSTVGCVWWCFVWMFADLSCSLDAIFQHFTHFLLTDDVVCLAHVVFACCCLNVCFIQFQFLNVSALPPHTAQPLASFLPFSIFTIWFAVFSPLQMKILYIRAWSRLTTMLFASLWMLLDLLLFVCVEWTRKAILWTSRRARLSGDCGKLKALFLHNRSNTVEWILEIQNTNEYKSELFSLNSTSMSCWKICNQSEICWA